VGGGGAVDEGDGFVGEGRVGLEEDEEGAECVTGRGCKSGKQRAGAGNLQDC